MTIQEIAEEIRAGKAVVGIEFGSTRIKAELIDSDNVPVAEGSFTWENRLENGVWTYSLEDIWHGLQSCYQDLLQDVAAKYQVKVTRLAAIGISAMMHGYLAFGKDGKLLVPFRTWRNTMTGEAAAKLSELFHFNIPQRWSIAHLYQAILNDEPHVREIDYVCTLAAYVHWQLTGQKVIGVGDGSGMFPIDSSTGDYDAQMIDKFNQLIANKGYAWKLPDIFPKNLRAGEQAGTLTEEGAKLLDVSGQLEAGVPLCPPEGDAGTGMVATNSVAVRTGNVSAGTSCFGMIVLEKPLQHVYPEIDLVTTPVGDPVAMAHVNNCTSDLNAWVSLFAQFQQAMQAAQEGAAHQTPWEAAGGNAGAAHQTPWEASGDNAGAARQTPEEDAGDNAGAVRRASGEVSGEIEHGSGEPAANRNAAVDMGQLFSVLYNKALEGDKDCGGLLSYNYFSGEPISKVDEGRPLFVRTPDARFTLANFMRSNLYSSLAVLKVGMDLLLKNEGVKVDNMMAHGGLFKTPKVGQSLLAAALNTPVTCMTTAGEGGAWGIALLAAYAVRGDGLPLDVWLDATVFADAEGVTLQPDPADVAGFDAYIEKYEKALPVEKKAVETV